MRALTAKQARALDVIRRHVRTRGQAPTVREIGAEIGVSSSCTVQRHLDALEKKGYVTRNRYKYRSLTLVGEPAPTALAPLLEALALAVDRTPTGHLTEPVREALEALHAAGWRAGE